MVEKKIMDDELKRKYEKIYEELNTLEPMNGAYALYLLKGKENV